MKLICSCFHPTPHLFQKHQSLAQMAKNPSHQDPDSMATFKKFKAFKLFEPSLGILFITVCIVFGFFYLDYSSVIRGNVFRFSNETDRFKWLRFNGYPSSGKRHDFLSVNDDMNGCDVFDGDWLWDESYPLYESKDCRFLDEGFRCSENGRPDFLYTKWRWQPKDCNLPRSLHGKVTF